MISYTNETKIRDLTNEIFQNEIEKLVKQVQLDFGQILTDEMYSHTVKRLSYLVSKKYPGFMLGEVKYVFEGMIEGVKKLSVSSILSIFSRYYEQKIEKQKQVYESKEQQIEQNVNYNRSSVLCRAIIHKINLFNSGQGTETNINDIAKKIESGEITVDMSVKNRNKHIWED